MMQLDYREHTQAITQPAERSVNRPTPVKATSVSSHVCQWLTSILYPLGRRVVLPSYFRRLTVIGQENIPTTGPVILAPTHRSRWDALVIPYAAGKPVTGRDLRYMVSEDEMKGLQGWFIRKVGGFPVNTRQPGISSFRHSVELLRNGEALVMFPEGNIFREGCVQPLKPGMARIALQVEASKPGMNLAIVPISIRYSHPIPHWGCEVTVTIGTPIQVADYYTKSVKKSTQRLTHDLEAALRELNQDELLPNALPVVTSSETVLL